MALADANTLNKWTSTLRGEAAKPAPVDTLVNPFDMFDSQPDTPSTMSSHSSPERISESELPSELPSDAPDNKSADAFVDDLLLDPYAPMQSQSVTQSSSSQPSESVAPPPVPTPPQQQQAQTTNPNQFEAKNQAEAALVLRQHNKDQDQECGLDVEQRKTIAASGVMRVYRKSDKLWVSHTRKSCQRTNYSPV